MVAPGRSDEYVVPEILVHEAGNLMRKSSLAVVGHIGPAARGDKMSAPHALAALAALGQPTRLEIFRLLMRREPGGLAAGAIADTSAARTTRFQRISAFSRVPV